MVPKWLPISLGVVSSFITFGQQAKAANNNTNSALQNPYIQGQVTQKNNSKINQVLERLTLEGVETFVSKKSKCSEPCSCGRQPCGTVCKTPV